MVLTRLEKITFTLLALGIVLGVALIFFRLQSIRSRNAAVQADVRLIADLTPRNVLSKDAKPLELGGEDDSLKLNINQATLADLDALPGMGKTFAERILEYRKEKGEIKDMGELLNLKGMTKKKYVTLSRLLTVKGGKAATEGGAIKLNLNFASEEELGRIPHVSKKLARSIIEIRNQRGGFHSLEDLQEVPGLSEERLKKFIDRVEVK